MEERYKLLFTGLFRAWPAKKAGSDIFFWLLKSLMTETLINMNPCFYFLEKNWMWNHIYIVVLLLFFRLWSYSRIQIRRKRKALIRSNKIQAYMWVILIGKDPVARSIILMLLLKTYTFLSFLSLCLLSRLIKAIILIRSVARLYDLQYCSNNHRPQKVEYSICRVNQETKHIQNNRVNKQYNSRKLS